MRTHESLRNCYQLVIYIKLPNVYSDEPSLHVDAKMMSSACVATTTETSIGSLAPSQLTSSATCYFTTTNCNHASLHHNPMSSSCKLFLTEWFWYIGNFNRSALFHWKRIEKCGSFSSQIQCISNGGSADRLRRSFNNRRHVMILAASSHTATAASVTGRPPAST